MTAWDDYLDREQRWIAEKLGLAGFVPIAAPPTRADTVKEAWRVVRDGWHRDAIDGRLIVAHDLGIIEPILFEQMRYGDEWVIEAEGVIVERLPSH